MHEPIPPMATPAVLNPPTPAPYRATSLSSLAASPPTTTTPSVLRPATSRRHTMRPLPLRPSPLSGPALALSADGVLSPEHPPAPDDAATILSHDADGWSAAHSSSHASSFSRFSYSTAPSSFSDHAHPAAKFRYSVVSMASVSECDVEGPSPPFAGEEERIGRNSAPASLRSPTAAAIEPEEPEGETDLEMGVLEPAAPRRMSLSKRFSLARLRSMPFLSSPPPSPTSSAHAPPTSRSTPASPRPSSTYSYSPSRNGPDYAMSVRSQPTRPEQARVRRRSALLPPAHSGSTFARAQKEELDYTTQWVTAVPIAARSRTLHAIPSTGVRTRPRTAPGEGARAKEVETPEATWRKTAQPPRFSREGLREAGVVMPISKREARRRSVVSMMERERMQGAVPPVPPLPRALMGEGERRWKGKEREGGVRGMDGDGKEREQAKEQEREEEEDLIPPPRPLAPTRSSSGTSVSSLGSLGAPIPSGFAAHDSPSGSDVSLSLIAHSPLACVASASNVSLNAPGAESGTGTVHIVSTLARSVSASGSASTVSLSLSMTPALVRSESPLASLERRVSAEFARRQAREHAQTQAQAQAHQLERIEQGRMMQDEEPLPPPSPPFAEHRHPGTPSASTPDMSRKASASSLASAAARSTSTLDLVQEAEAEAGTVRSAGTPVGTPSLTRSRTVSTESVSASVRYAGVEGEGEKGADADADAETAPQVEVQVNGVAVAHAARGGLEDISWEMLVLARVGWTGLNFKLPGLCYFLVFLLFCRLSAVFALETSRFKLFHYVLVSSFRLVLFAVTNGCDAFLCKMEFHVSYMFIN
ncbi:uncharacterized protein LAESUDRAFT_454847 [Laetiporus sulphureus 93-53]|uniref:Uncharacterized protein n=1 Tax=Laetiporus sulphureus 93-53 TaxID=1314785 RepID=A0A165BT13_9APHY|nr:uncharacterized protein LAESUDRAFT_454847 [Laetiporus sulphureus 93-53]KZT01595.1 hypothetical protein LAESUDRAFT_454847 [Laetiporus sulphureus 93-53]